MGEIDAMTATEMVAAVRAGQVSRRELLEAHVERIGRINPVINALVELRIEQALADAEEADRRHDERADLPLDGVPITLKDHFDVAGMLHTEGVAALSERRSTTDAVMVQRLKAAGAIMDQSRTPIPTGRPYRMGDSAPRFAGCGSMTPLSRDGQTRVNAQPKAAACRSANPVEGP